MNHSEKYLCTQAVNLYSYLREFVKLRTRVIKSFEQYEKVIWLADIPKDEFCFSIYRPHSKQVDSAIWIEIPKPSLEDPPSAPQQLAPWLHPSDFKNSSLDRPRLLDTIPNPNFFDQEDVDNIVPAYLELESYYEDLSPLQERYIENKWRPWAIADKEKRRVQDIYAHFFSLYQLQKKLGEEYEIVFALGLLQWKTPNNHAIKRHVLIAQTNIDFESHSGKITLAPSADGANLKFEIDMIEVTEQPDANLQKKMESQLAELDDQIQNKVDIQFILKEWVYSLHPEGQYRDHYFNKLSISNKPVLQFAPAIILRKRSNRTILSTLDEIIGQLQNGSKIPNNIKTLVTIAESGSAERTDIDIQKNYTWNSEVYFPLSTNEEQREIIRVFNRQQGVVVQGPPGTGKSHTIANLICHLLATGNRILVTSHTERALKVLKEKIPDEISALCVQALGNDHDSLQMLEYSVQGITDKYAKWNANVTISRIQKLKKDLDWERRKEVILEQRLRAIRESETYKHNNIFVSYSGTLQEIAQKLKVEEKLYGWLPDSPPEHQDSPLSNHEATELYRFISEIGSDQEHLTKVDFSMIAAFPLPKKFEEMTVREWKSKSRFTHFNINRNDFNFIALLKIRSKMRNTMRDCVTRFLKCYDRLQRSPEPWVKKISEDILAGRIESWQLLLQNTNYRLGQAKELKAAIGQIIVDGINGQNFQKMKADANCLLNHLKDGGNFGIWLFRPKVVKKCLYLISEILINGQPCKNMALLAKLINYLTVQEILHWLRDDWLHLNPINKNASVEIQLSEFTNLQRSLNEAFELSQHLTSVRKMVVEIPEIQTTYWYEINSFKELLNCIDAADAALSYHDVQISFKDLENQSQELLENNRDHPVSNGLFRAIKNRDFTLYEENFIILEQIIQIKNLIDRRDQLLAKLNENSPVLASTLQSNINNDAIRKRLEYFNIAWNWARANNWLKQMTDSEEQNNLKKELAFHQKSIQKIITEMAALKAWEFCLNNMSDYERQHLISWKKAVEKIGKGTGKYANRYRREARNYMDKCRSAIPAWIMPIYRVTETILPQNNLFDVVIIDEASQSGPEALILQYYGKRIVVVGDDKQISPDFVGVNKESVALLNRKYLQDIPHSDHLGVDNSFFDQAEIRYPNPIRLREHYRCMPEIIQFSNNNWYQATPLIPLRQYTNSRLSPIVTTNHVTSGYAEGDSSKIINKPEADAIVEQIKRCCDDSKYYNKSIGVISLQGSIQAKHIERLLLDVIGPEEIDKRKIVCGDAYAFQGDERDVIFLTMVAAPNKRTRALTDTKTQRRFNVATSRAKDQMWLFHSMTLNDLSPTCLRYKLLEYCQNPEIKQTEVNGINIASIRRLASSNGRSDYSLPEPFDSWFEVDVFLKIVERGYRVIPQYKVAQFRIDMVVQGIQGALAVECDGDAWHGPEVYERDSARERILTRCGWRFWRVRGSNFYRNQSEATKTLWTTLNELGIKPSAKE